MTNREQALSEALEAGINVLKKNFGDDYDRALVLQNVPMLLEVMWPYIEGYHEKSVVHNFDDMFLKRFPNHVLESYGSTVLDYIIGNVQTAVANEIILMMETWGQTLKDAQSSPALNRNHRDDRDYDVASAHVKELISEVRQYRTLGSRGSRTTHTGTIPTQESHE